MPLEEGAPSSSSPPIIPPFFSPNDPSDEHEDHHPSHLPQESPGRGEAYTALSDTAGVHSGIPAPLLSKWLKLPEPRTSEDADTLLDPFKVLGSFSMSDSSGLSKLSKVLPLVHVLKLIAEPKEILFKYGCAIGGTPNQVWVADNTQMYYPPHVPTSLVVTQLLAAQREILATCRVRVGIGVGCTGGEALYKMGQSYWGHVLDDMEDFTEEHSEGGEVNISQLAWDAMVREGGGVERGLVVRGTREGKLLLDVAASLLPTDGPFAPHPPTPSASIFYPASFPHSFHAALRALDTSDPAAVEALTRSNSRDLALILVRTFVPPGEKGLLLDEKAAAMVAFKEVLQAGKRAGAHVHEVSYLLLLTLPTIPQALALVRTLGGILRTKGTPFNVGCTFGQLLAFGYGMLGGGGTVMGSPINIASKLAEDTEDRGYLFFDHTTIPGAQAEFGVEAVEQFTISKSGVDILAGKVLVERALSTSPPPTLSSSTLDPSKNPSSSPTSSCCSIS